MDIGPGTHVTPHIRLVRPLGQGGMGSVWLADHLGLQAPVAVKLMSPRIAADARAVARFASEAAAAARIRSPHVVEVLDHGVADGTPFIVMEQLHGEDLQTRLERDGRLTARALVPIVRGVCRALARAHAIGVVHRDIKPANLFLVDGDDGPVVKVLDFGLAKVAGDAPTASGSVFGTLAYLSPEQAQSSRATSPQSDLWSLGVVVYQCLTGALPFADSSLMGMCIAIDEARFRPPSEVSPDLPPAIDSWLARALARAPRDRFASATEMADAFARAVEVPASPVPFFTSRPRRPWALPLVGGIAILALLGIATAPSWGSPAPQPIVSAAPALPAATVIDDPGPPEPPAPAAVAPPGPSPAPPQAAAAPPRTTAPAPASTSSRGPALRLTALITNDLYPPPYVQGVVAARTAALQSCFVPAGAAAPLSAYEVYTIAVSSTGAVTRVGHPGQAAPAAVDACMNRELRRLSLRPTDSGAAGSMDLMFVVR